ncbi:MAG: S9 family peptidase [Pseudomonadota bacterium]
MTKRSVLNGAEGIAAPAVTKERRDIEQHGALRYDDYGWLRDEKWQEVLHRPDTLSAPIRDALEAENQYYDSVTEPLADLRKQLLAEMRGRMKENDASVPVKDGSWKYWSKYREGGEYPIFMRAPADGGDESVLFDGDAESKGAKFFDIGDISHSPDHRLLAMAIDRVGSENYVISVKDIETGAVYDERVERAGEGGAYWAADSASFFYIVRDDHQRAKWVKLHRLGTDPADDPVIYEEPDDMFYMNLSKSQDGAYIFITSSSITSSEVRAIPADDVAAAPILIEPRTKDLDYEVEHHDGAFYILTNADGALDYKIMKAPVKKPGRRQWKEWVPHEPGRYILSVMPYKDYFVRLERADALPRVVVSDYHGEEHAISFDEAAYEIGVLPGFEYATATLRFSYSSPATPRQVFDYDMGAKTRTLMKTQDVPSGHDASLYVVERITAPGKGGVSIPVTILRLKETTLDGAAPVLLYGYGAYGITIPAGFSTNALSLVDRGVIYVIAHPRGGAARGRGWYEDGKLANKMNTFEDFIAVAETLIEKNYTSAGSIVIHGGSAGGLLVGASINLRPDLFGGVIAVVPFVDVLNTISDATLPLTPPEWEEWGNPIHRKEEYGWIAEYSPYDNIKDENYPPIMATGGLTDYRVTYWEPAKWVARLRDEARGGPFLLRMNMGAGHGGSAARFEQLDERAHYYAFALGVMGKQTTPPIAHKTESQP